MEAYVLAPTRKPNTTSLWVDNPDFPCRRVVKEYYLRIVLPLDDFLS